ncbi:hypothetical protein IRJ41_017719, partial [Triplophysa rosa]
TVVPAPYSSSSKWATTSSLKDKIPKKLIQSRAVSGGVEVVSCGNNRLLCALLSRTDGLRHQGNEIPERLNCEAGTFSPIRFLLKCGPLFAANRARVRCTTEGTDLDIKAISKGEKRIK